MTVLSDLQSVLDGTFSKLVEEINLVFKWLVSDRKFSFQSNISPINQLKWSQIDLKVS